MSRLQEKFAELKKRGEAALIPFVTAGDPDLKTTLKIMRALEAGGADCIELGIPFSDPTADGPTIQRASERALKNRITLGQILRMLRQFRSDSETPVILFGYFNPFFQHGLESFCRQAARAGADGVLCVDLPPEESAELKRWTDFEGMDLIFLLSPTSGADRVKLVARTGRGFIYYVSVTGVTGARRSFEDQLRQRVADVQRLTSLPVGVGFGISTPRQAAWIAEFADAAVIGSALVETIERANGSSAKAQAAGDFVFKIKRAMKKSNSNARI
ncbi:MAG: tryptophan synthase subunit alpha [Candidatus Binatia bacterium]